MKKIIYKIFFGAIIILIMMAQALSAKALEPGTIVYRTTDDGKMFGYSKHPLLEIENDILVGINPGHAGIYIGQENGEDYIVEALADGIVKTPARYFVNESIGEELVAAKLPKQANALDRLKAVTIAKNLAGLNLGYDFDFQKQKGPRDGEWTCVGLTEKIYESAGIQNPGDLNSLVYDPQQYKIDITPDGFDNREIVNDEGDCLSKNKEFSKIARRENLILPAPEIIGYNAGREYKGERYFFLPYTQMIQPTLREEKIDIVLSSNFNSKDVRGKTPILWTLLRWSFVNNPASTIKNTASKIKSLVNNISSLVFGQKITDDFVFNSEDDKQKTNVKNEEVDKSVNATAIKINSSENNSILAEEKKESKISSSQVDKINKDEININSEQTLGGDTINKPVSVSVKINKTDEIASNNSNSFSSELLKPLLTKINSASHSQNSSASNQSSSIVKKIEYSPSNNSLSKILTGAKPAGASSEDATNDSIARQSDGRPATALISKIYSTDNNDFIELYNPLDYDFDLAEEGFRLEKTKTAEDPSLMVRIGNEADGFYPKGTVIKAKGFYLLVRDDASKYFLDMADAVITRKDFSWTGSGYTIYLGKGSISSSADADIIDAVGFGAAKYFQGNGPTSAIADNYFLDRIDNKQDNSLDFRLQIINDPGIVWDNSSGNQQDNNHDNSQNNNNQAGDVPADFVAFVEPEPILSDNISGLWHFDECYSQSLKYAIGKFGCGAELRYEYEPMRPSLSQNINLNKTTISFYYRDPNNALGFARLNLKLKNSDGKSVLIVLEQGLFQAEGLPNTAWRYWNSPVLLDSNWHSFSLVVDKDNGYWAAYFDGVEKYRQVFAQTLPSNFSELEVYSDTYPVFFDELVVWDRALPPSEIKQNWQLSAPFSPVVARIAQKPAELKYFWDFNEGYKLVNEGGGVEANDLVSGANLVLPPDSWVWRGTNNSAIKNVWNKDLSVNLNSALASKDMSLAFWWRSQFYPNEGRSTIALQKNKGAKFGLAIDQYRRGFYFNNVYGIFSEGQDVDLPFDENWHYVAIVYDSYRYNLKMYIDGEVKREMPFYWLKDGEHPDSLIIKNELNSIELDDLGIWEGALTPLQVKQLFVSSRVEP